MTTAITKSDTTRAEEVRQEIDAILNKAKEAEDVLQHSYVHFGRLLAEVSKEEYWRLWGKHSFGDYMMELAEKYRRGRTQSYMYFSTAKALLPYVSEEDLDTMGISKAIELKKAVKQTGQKPDPKIVEMALQPETSISDVRRAIFDLYNMPTNEQPKGIWMDFGGAYLTPEEREIFDRSFDVAMRTDPPVKLEGMPEWARQKECQMRFRMEYLATYEEAVKKGEA